MDADRAIEIVELVGAPSDGLVVKNGDAVTMKANILPTSYVPPANEPKWYYQQLKTDGSWEAWTSFETSAHGKTYTHTTTMIRRRSHKAGQRWTWERFYRLQERWIPRPRVAHPYPNECYNAKYSR